MADKVGSERFWPEDGAARAMARSMVVEMHSSFHAIRSQCPMNIRGAFAGAKIDEDAKNDIIRILTLWAEARARFANDGPFLFGTFCAADIHYAPVVTRLRTYNIPVPGFAESYMQAIWDHPLMQQWVNCAENEEWVIEQFEIPLSA